jgi:hypothetical protein
MPKKKGSKITKMKKSVTKTQKQSGALMLAEKVEKEFRQLPAKLARLYRRELMIQKQQDAKLKTEINKVKAVQKEAQKKQAKLASAKTTKSTPKQLIKAKKAEAAAAKTLKTLVLQMNQTAKNTDMLRAKQTKFTLLGKELVRFEKQCLTQASSAKPLRKARVQKTKSPLNKRQIDLNNTDEESVRVSSETETVEIS